MTLPIHWEWRGFGAVSGKFAHRYSTLPAQFSSQSVEDAYLWVPGLEVNVKLRDIPQEPFKFKRLQGKDGPLEQWAEKPEDICVFPLNQAGWDTLAATLATVDLTLGPYPGGDVDAGTTRARLEEVGARTVTVHKLRESRLWSGPNGPVKVEWACIRSPQAIITIGLETWDPDPGGSGLPGEQAKEDLLAAIQELGLHDEPLQPMNYVRAVAAWASGGKI